MEGEEVQLRQQVLERAAGVPLFLVSCVQALRSGQLTKDGITHVPWSLREAILQRVLALQEVAHQMLRMAAGSDVACYAPCWWSWALDLIYQKR